MYPKKNLSIIQKSNYRNYQGKTKRTLKTTKRKRTSWTPTEAVENFD